MKNSETQLKLIAIVLPEPLFSIVREEQEYISRTWGPRMALRTPPHITIIPPITVKKEETVILDNLLKKATKRVARFKMEVVGYGAFKPRVVYIKTGFPRELNNLYSELRNSIEMKLPHVLYRYPDRAYHPHITIAYRDVERDDFREIWKYYKRREIKFEWEVGSVFLLDNNDGGWGVEKECPLVYNSID